MKKNILFALIAVLIFYNNVRAENEKWRETKSKHFIVYYKSASDVFLDNLVDAAEDYYDEIADNLGFTRFDFWLWEDRAKIYIYDDADDYKRSTGQPGWSAGSVLPKGKIIKTFPSEMGFFNSILPHEMGHIIFREFVGFDNPAIPLWLDEGVASYQEKSKHIFFRKMIEDALREDNLFDIQELTRLNPAQINDQNKVNLFYAQTLGIIDYLVEEFGKDKFVYFCRGLRDKKNLEEALDYAYPFKNLQELEKAWLRYMED